MAHNARLNFPIGPDRVGDGGGDFEVGDPPSMDVDGDPDVEEAAIGRSLDREF